MNWAVRYFPVVDILKREGLYRDGSLLELGSGPIGIGAFRKVPFIGCDLSFASKPKPPMFPIKISAAELPFADNLFEVVIASDVLEHVPPALRAAVVGEATRVASKLVIFAFPSGKEAWESDRDLLKHYRELKRSAPEWLTEHMEAPFPGAEFFTNLPGWKVEQFGNDGLKFHAWLMRREMSRLFGSASRAVLRFAPGILRIALRTADRAPYYRQVFVLRKIEAVAEKSKT